MNLFSSVKKSIGRSFHRASEIISVTVHGADTHRIKLFVAAVLSRDEETAITLYTEAYGSANTSASSSTQSEEYRRSLQTVLPPNSMIPLRKYSGDTPLVLACRYALPKLIEKLLQLGGNTCFIRPGTRETLLHVCCRRSDEAAARAKCVSILLEHVNLPSPEEVLAGKGAETISVNSVDSEGNTAIHLAAAAVLRRCVERLIAAGAILSLVNSGNETVCETIESMTLGRGANSRNVNTAEAKMRSQLAHALELAILFSPPDEDEWSTMVPHDSSGGITDAVVTNDSPVSSEDSQRGTHRELSTLTSRDQQNLDVRSSATILADAALESAMERFGIHRSQARQLTHARLLVDCVSLEDEAIVRYGDDAVLIITKLLHTLTSDDGNLQELDIKVSNSARSLESMFSDISDNTEQLNKTIYNTDRWKMLEAIAESLLVRSSWEVLRVVESLQSDPLTILSDVLPSLRSIKPESQLPSVPSMSISDTVLPPLPPKPLSTTESIATDCEICGESTQPSLPLSSYTSNTLLKPSGRRLECPAGHSFCGDCWTSYLSVQINENGATRLSCPAFQCIYSIPSAWAPILLPPETENRLRQQRLRHVADCSGGRVCGRSGCGLTVFARRSSPILCHTVSTNIPTSTTILNSGDGSDGAAPTAWMCRNGHSFCQRCSSPAHSPATCEDAVRWQQLVRTEISTLNESNDNGNENVNSSEMNGDDLANALWVAANTKRCPRCSTAIEKDEGCNHMTCRKCRKEFCWLCRQDWSLHNDGTGGFFQCNRFAQQELGGETTDSTAAAASEVNTTGTIGDESAGDARIANLRARQRSMQMARFIHHFGRFRAYADSAALEGNMRTTTLARIGNSLEEARTNPSMWLYGTRVVHPLYSEEFLTTPPIENSSEVQTERSHNPMFNAPAASIMHILNLRREWTGCISSTPSFPILSVTSSSSSSSLTDHQNLSHEYSLPRLDHPKYQSHKTTDRCLYFLQQGFDELLRCRHLVQWSYVFTFFEFNESTLLERFTRRQLRRWVPLLQRYTLSFERGQSELEAIVETLSDVVARRRLRASVYEITRVTQAARLRRLELEALIVNFVAARTAELIRVSRPRARTNAERTTNDIENADGNNITSGVGRFASHILERALVSLDMVDSRMARILHRIVDSNTNTGDEEGATSTTSAAVLSTTSAASETEENDPEDTLTNREAELRAVVAEAEEMNRAILLSLASAGRLQSTRSTSSNRAEPSEINVEELMALGFPRADVMQALSLNGDDLEQAADWLYNRP